MSLSLSPNSLYRQTTDCTEGGSLTREHCSVQSVPITTKIVSLNPTHGEITPRLSGIRTRNISGDRH